MLRAAQTAQGNNKPLNERQYSNSSHKRAEADYFVNRMQSDDPFSDGLDDVANEPLKQQKPSLKIGRQTETFPSPHRVMFNDEGLR